MNTRMKSAVAECVSLVLVTMLVTVGVLAILQVSDAYAARYEGVYNGNDPIVRRCRDEYLEDMRQCERRKDRVYTWCYENFDSCKGDSCDETLEECLSGADEEYDQCADNAANERLCCEGFMGFC